MDQVDLILLSLEVAAEKAEDLTPLIYPRFFKQYPEAEIEFGNDPSDYLKGQMLVNLLMEIIGQAENKVYPSNIRRWISDHRAYGVVPQMYTTMLDCMRDVVKELNGSAWNDNVDAAWQAQFDRLMAYVDEIYA